MSKVIRFFLAIGITMSAHGGIKNTLKLDNPSTTNLTLEWDPSAVININSLASVFSGPNASKLHTIVFDLKQKLSPMDEEQCKTLLANYENKARLNQLIVRGNARTLSTTTTDILQTIPVNEINITYTTDEPLNLVHEWAKKWMLNSPKVNLTLPRYRGSINVEDLSRSQSSWTTSTLSDEGDTKVNLAHDMNTKLSINTQDIVRSMFSPSELKNHAVWSEFLEHNTQDKTLSLALPQYSIPMQNTEELSFFIKWYKDKDLSAVIQSKTMYNADKKEVKLNKEDLSKVAKLKTLNSFVLSALNKDSYTNIAKDHLFIENWEDFLKFPHAIYKNKSPEQNLSIEKAPISPDYTFCLWLKQSDVIEKKDSLSEADKEELINALGPWSKSKLEKLEVNITELRKKHKEITHIVKDNKTKGLLGTFNQLTGKQRKDSDSL